MAGIAINVHGLADLEATPTTADRSSWVELTFTTDHGNRLDVTVFMRGETHSADAEAMAAAINALRKPKPVEEPATTTAELEKILF